MPTSAVPVAPGVIAIDTWMAERPAVTSAYLLEGPEPALVETGPTTSAGAVTEGLALLGIGSQDLAHVIVTHIHLDHAGGAGTIAAAFPRATVWVHERGAPHLADPTRLERSAARVYGGEERLRALFGPMAPVPGDRLRSVHEASTLRFGPRSIDVLHTPGHASHHVALLDADTGSLFVGDALGVHLPDVGVLRPATPPPEIDIELMVESIERIRARAGSRLLFSHFGPVDGAEELCALAVDRLRRWAGVVREALVQTDDDARIAEILRERTADEFDAAPPGADLDRYEILSSVGMNAAGLARYWRKREEAQAHPPGDGSG
jgi:glyoxylase-like metal-dependent hydrolase (beta-lactamase superfamily II)